MYSNQSGNLNKGTALEARPDVRTPKMTTEAPRKPMGQADSVLKEVVTVREGDKGPRPLAGSL